jgi:hypothetical protein
MRMLISRETGLMYTKKQFTLGGFGSFGVFKRFSAWFSGLDMGLEEKRPLLDRTTRVHDYLLGWLRQLGRRQSLVLHL